VIAADFFDDPHKWASLRSPMSNVLKQARERANKEIGHLTRKRTTGTPLQKAWAIQGLTQEVLRELRKFEKNASPARLDSSVAKVLK
jgi:hypothetical protein